MSRAAHATQSQLLAPMPARASLPGVQRLAMPDRQSDPAGPAVPRFAQSLSALPALPKPQRLCAECAAEEEEKPRRKAADATLLDHEEDEKSGQGTPVRPSLEVGPANDSYEREADAIAAETLARPSPAAMAEAGPVSATSETLSPSAQPLRIRRLCSSCGAEEETPRARRLPVASRVESGVQRKCAACAEEEKQARKKSRVRTEREGGAPPKLAASPASLTSGGRALPAATQDFFESRMGRDLSHVRVHEGSEASQLNSGIDAHAFTYGSHIWLGGGEKADTGFTMAHELAHVLQQTQPGETKARRRSRNASSSPVKIQRKGPVSGADLKAFWLPDSPGAIASPKTQHENIHNAAIDALGKANGNLIQEAPIPNATRKGPTFSSHGWADLMSAKTTIGLKRIAATPTTGQSNLDNFTVADVSEVKEDAWKFRGSKKGGKELVHNSERRPQMDSAGAILGLDEAPKQVQIGEVKPGHNPGYAAGGVQQIGHYADGIKGVVDAVQQEQANAKPKPKPTWHFRTQNFFLGSAQIPEGWNATRDGNKNLHELVLHYKTKNYRPKPGTGSVPRKKLVGRWVMAKHPTLKGVWVYFMRPNEASLKTFFNRKGDNVVIKRVGKKLQKDVLGPLMATPEKKKKRRRAIGAPVTATPGARSIRRKGGSIAKAPTTVDPFDFSAWNIARVGQTGAPGDSFKAEFEKAFPDQDQENMIFNAGAIESLEELRKNNGPLGISMPVNAREMKNHGREIRRFQFWSGPQAAIVGRLRDMFGSLSVTVWKLAAAAKEKIGGLLEKFQFNGSGKASGFKRIAMKVGANLLKLIGTMVVTNTVEALAKCITSGIANKLESFVDAEIEFLESKIEQIETFIKDAEKNIIAELETIFKSVTDKYEAEIEAFKDLAEDAAFILELAGVIQKAIRAGRLAACVTSTASGPGAAFVCGAALVDEVLSWVDMSPIDLLAETLMSSCEAQKFLSTFIASSEFIREIPVKLGEPIRNQIETLLPPDFKDVICSKAEFEAGIRKFKKGDLDCKPGSGGNGGGGSGSGNTKSGGVQPGQPAGTGEAAGKAGEGGKEGAADGSTNSAEPKENQPKKTSGGGAAVARGTVLPVPAGFKPTSEASYTVQPIASTFPNSDEIMRAKEPTKTGLQKRVEIVLIRSTDNKQLQIPVDVIFIVTDSSNYASRGVVTCKLGYVADFYVPEFEHSFTVAEGLTGTMDIPRNIAGGTP